MIHINVLVLLVMVIAIFGAGYAVRGWVRRELAAASAELKSWEQRLDAAVAQGEAALRFEVVKILGEIRAKL